MTERLALQPLEPGIDPLSYEYFDVLKEAVQPDSQIPTEQAIQKLLEIIPKGNNDANETINLLDVCYETAEQIPYDHASQSKLVTLIDLVLNSAKLAQPIDDAPGGTDRGARYTRLAQSFSDHWNSSKPSRGASAYVNFQSFAARLYERGMMSGTDTAKLVCEDALKDPSKVDQGDREAYVMAAAQWILLFGSQVYHDVLDQPEPLTATPKQWRKWREELEKASGKQSKTYAGLRDEARLLAGRAAEEMRTIEVKMKS